MAKRSPVKAKKKGTKVTAKRTAAKKVVAKKKTAVKKRTAPKKKVTAKKTVVAKKKVINPTRKPIVKVTKKATPKKNIRKKTVVTESVKQHVETIPDTTPVEIVETSLPPVEEKSPEVDHVAIPLPGADKKSMERSAVRHYDNHHIQLSNRKGGIKPSGKKPLW